MKQLFFISLLLFSVAMNTNAQTAVKLWKGNPPSDNKITGAEVIMENGRISNVSSPDITIYLPEKDKNKEAAVIICPGGGYTRLAVQHEGHDFAEWLKSEGYTAIVLKYRLPNQYQEVPLDDFQQAIRYVHAKSEEWGTKKVGVAGFSAGGHLASTASTQFSTVDTRPDFSILFYPVITMTELTHKGSKTNLLGENPSSADIIKYSSEKQVNANTPPAILLLSDDDLSVPPQNSSMYYEALKANKIPASMYIFPSGGHGWGMNDSFLYRNEMLSLLRSWLNTVL